MSPLDLEAQFLCSHGSVVSLVASFTSVATKFIFKEQRRFVDPSV
jgi:hypothetical protein